PRRQRRRKESPSSWLRLRRTTNLKILCNLARIFSNPLGASSLECGFAAPCSSAFIGGFIVNPCPVELPQFESLNLARRGLGKGLDEFDPARVLVRRQLFFDEDF